MDTHLNPRFRIKWHPMTWRPILDKLLRAIGRALTLCPQLCTGIQPGARFPARSADALLATLYGHFTQAIHRNRPITSNALSTRSFQLNGRWNDVASTVCQAAGIYKEYKPTLGTVYSVGAYTRSLFSST